MVKKEVRQEIVKKYVLDNPTHNEQEILTYLRNEHKVNISAITLKRDLKDLGISRSDGIYEVAGTIKPTRSDIIRNDLKALFAFDRPRIIRSTDLDDISSNKEGSIKQVHAIYIKTFKGTAPSVAKLIDSLYGNKILGTTYGDNLVVVYSTNKKNVDKFYTRLRNLRTKNSSQDDDIQED